ncbi:hypothetical protein EON67_10025 [archaeon]|nr:MAG: hypothetical protein EON67_10025 [archaeon]
MQSTPPPRASKSMLPVSRPRPHPRTHTYCACGPCSVHRIGRVCLCVSPTCRPIVHGMLFSSLFGTLFGATIPGAVYLSQSLAFKAPVYIDEQVTARIEVVSVRAKPHIVTCSTRVLKADASIACEGEAVVLLPPPESPLRA